MTVGSASKTLQQFPDCIVVSGREKFQAASLRTKDEANVQTSATLEVISSKPANA